jgi:hypothetical protein
MEALFGAPLLITSLVCTYPYKGTKFGMLKELRNDRAFKLGRILDDKGLAIVGPASNRWVARINHVVGFCKKKRNNQCE